MTNMTRVFHHIPFVLLLIKATGMNSAKEKRLIAGKLVFTWEEIDDLRFEYKLRPGRTPRLQVTVRKFKPDIPCRTLQGDLLGYRLYLTVSQKPAKHVGSVS